MLCPSSICTCLKVDLAELFACSSDVIAIWVQGTFRCLSVHTVLGMLLACLEQFENVGIGRSKCDSKEGPCRPIPKFLGSFEWDTWPWPRHRFPRWPWVETNRFFLCWWGSCHSRACSLGWLHTDRCVGASMCLMCVCVLGPVECRTRVVVVSCCCIASLGELQHRDRQTRQPFSRRCWQCLRSIWLVAFGRSGCLCLCQNRVWVRHWYLGQWDGRMLWAILWLVSRLVIVGTI